MKRSVLGQPQLPSAVVTPPVFKPTPRSPPAALPSPAVLQRYEPPHPPPARPQPPLTTVTNGVVKLNSAALLDDDLPVSRAPVVNDFHRNWEAQKNDQYNRANPNSIPPLPPGLSPLERHQFMNTHDNAYPTVKIYQGDTVHHFTTSGGASGIGNTQMMYPSVVAGVQTTHFGRGVYFTHPQPLADRTHGDVTRAIYTADNAENRRRSEHLATVDVSEHSLIEYRLRNKAPVLMLPTTEPVDMTGKVHIRPTSELVRPDYGPPASSASSAEPKKARPRKPATPPGFKPLVTDWDLAFQDYLHARRDYPHIYGRMSFPEFILSYKQLSAL